MSIRTRRNIYHKYDSALLLIQPVGNQHNDEGKDERDLINVCMVVTSMKPSITKVMELPTKMSFICGPGVQPIKRSRGFKTRMPPLSKMKNERYRKEDVGDSDSDDADDDIAAKNLKPRRTSSRRQRRSNFINRKTSLRHRKRSKINDKDNDYVDDDDDSDDSDDMVVRISDLKGHHHNNKSVRESMPKTMTMLTMMKTVMTMTMMSAKSISTVVTIYQVDTKIIILITFLTLMVLFMTKMKMKMSMRMRMRTRTMMIMLRMSNDFFIFLHNEDYAPSFLCIEYSILLLTNQISINKSLAKPMKGFRDRVYINDGI